MKSSSEATSGTTSFVLEGCSWGMIFYIGVYKAMLQKYSKEQLSKVKVGGSSSGCLAALGLCLGKTVQECLDMYNELAHIAEVFGVLGLMSVYHEIALRRWLPVGGNEWRGLVGRLHVNVTRYFCRSEVISDWASNDDIVSALHASMHIPFYMTYTRSVRGSWGIDGGFSANLFKLDSNTITISVTSKKGVIHPTSLLTTSDCFSPPSMERRMVIFEDGANIKLPDIPDVTENTTIPSPANRSDSQMPSSSSSSSIAADVKQSTMKSNGLFFRGKSMLSFKKPGLSIIRIGMCSVFWFLRVLEVAPYSILLGAAAVCIPRDAWMNLYNKLC